ncbi:MAG: sulfatase-like hydrolase/transferase [Acidobacteriia bacterium]|nr:sulfatase-like hydrolase/transferase [Terriglobia bacterium]
MTQLNRREVLKSSATVLAAPLAACGTAGPSASGGSQPNVILCMADDQGWGDTGYNGHPFLQTPHLDAMSQAGLRFDRFYSGAPVCSPTRGSALTGRHPYRYGIPTANAGHVRDQEVTLAELLKEHGYSTGHFGKWHLGTLTNDQEDGRRGGPRAPPDPGV